MAKILCTLPNASAEISGVKFLAHDKGMLSEEISDEAAASFVEIPGYELVGGVSAAEKAAAEAEASAIAAAEAKKLEDEANAAKQAETEKLAAKEAAEAEKAALLERAAAIGFHVKSTWGVDRLKAEVEAAEKAAAEAKAKTE